VHTRCAYVRTDRRTYSVQIYMLPLCFVCMTSFVVPNTLKGHKEDTIRMAKLDYLFLKCHLPIIVLVQVEA